MRKLFSPEEPVPLVLAGSVLQKGSHPALVDAIREGVKRDFPRVRLVKLEDPPVLGAVLGALDELGQRPGAALRNQIRSRLTERLEGMSPR
jgi:hypothetical protein